MNLSLQQYFEEHRRNNRKLLSLFLTAGFPTADATLPLLQLLDKAGADLIELGMPFSDPLADGPTIQRTSQIALRNGVTVKSVLEMAASRPGGMRAPIILMGYYNPILKFGMEKFVQAATNAGVQGLIIPDLPPEESTALRERALAAGLSLIYLVSPNTSLQRLELIDRMTTSFVYAVSITGVTGARTHVAAQAKDFLERLRQQIRHPILVGFGVANASDAQALASACDGVIVGSALLHEIEKHWLDETGRAKVAAFVQTFSQSLRA